MTNMSESVAELPQAELIINSAEHYFGNISQLMDCFSRLRKTANFQKPEIRQQFHDELESNVAGLKTHLPTFSSKEQNIIADFCNMAEQIMSTTDPNFDDKLKIANSTCNAIIRPHASSINMFNSTHLD